MRRVAKKRRMWGGGFADERRVLGKNKNKNWLNWTVRKESSSLLIGLLVQSIQFWFDYFSA